MIYQRNGVRVLICDGTPDSSGETFDPAGVELPEGSVPIQREFQETPADCFGWADLYWVGSEVWADLTVHQPFYGVPVVGGIILDRRQTDTKVITRCEIRRLGVTLEPCDKRLTPIAVGMHLMPEGEKL